ncbi:MAG: EscU/YscU/HrcU family type III secretion system export apparatus switch protein, partial [Pseudomonadales bacterium]|nr:EscU/YscU/HrcU family type III secretion system export apparatus switch protein [Pseudomonadales bacterium]
YFFNGVFDELLALGTRPLEGALVESSSLITLCVLLLSSVLILVAAIDVPYQLWQHSTKLKMTRQEVRDEMKETEGRPEVKGRIRSLRQEIAKRRMMRDVKTADVVVRNPTHFAVALKYEQGDVYAPRVVAKGRDLVALAIIEAAEECGVTVLSAPPLARALYATTELGHEIPQKLYIAVAQVLAYVYQLRSAQPWEKASVIEPKDIPVPPELLDDMK